MSNIHIVKNKMLNSYNAVGKLEIGLSKLINTLSVISNNHFNKTTPIVDEILPMLDSSIKNIEDTVRDTENNLKRYLHEFNKASRKTIADHNSIKIGLNQLKISSVELDYLYEYYGPEKVFVEHLELEQRLKYMIPKLSQFKNSLMLYKMMIDFNNKKLRIGVRK